MGQWRQTDVDAWVAARDAGIGAIELWLKLAWANGLDTSDASADDSLRAWGRWNDRNGGPMAVLAGAAIVVAESIASAWRYAR